ncbi:MAG: hypothetical protein K6B70_00725 [Clostridia bacterium]|nr:hypothetical protein [Clostridia bacterium]
MNRTKVFLFGIVCTLIMLVSGIYSFTNVSILTIKNEIYTGAVKIGIEEYTISNGKEILYKEENAPTVVPGQEISLIPRISNVGDSCYIRAKVSYSQENNTNSTNFKKIGEISDDWVIKDNYFYYKPVVKTGEKVDFFKSLIIPEDIPNDYQGKSIYFNISVEAIQADNFKPNFESDKPWDGVVVEKASEEVYKIDKVQLSSNAKVEYENSAQKYIDVPDDFFGKLGHLVPGDVITHEVKINNTTSEQVECFVSLKKESDLSDKVVKLLKQLELTITVDDKVVYQGSLYDVERISLGKYWDKKSSKAIFAIKVPEELGNDYSILNTSINWVFSIDGKEKKAEPSPQTGDVKVKAALGIFVAAAIGLIIALFADKKLKKQE